MQYNRLLVQNQELWFKTQLWCKAGRRIFDWALAEVIQSSVGARLLILHVDRDNRGGRELEGVWLSQRGGQEEHPDVARPIPIRSQRLAKRKWRGLIPSL